MATNIPDWPPRDSRRFQNVVDAFLAGEGLPFSEILSAERIKRIFAKHGCLFGLHGVYTAAIMVWSSLSQVLRDGIEASCQSAVARVVSYCQQAGMPAPTEDTGDYCRARAKLSEEALHELSGEVAEQLEQAADKSWLWKGKLHPKLIDGFTFTMPDTPKNQARYPHPETQKPGVGLPIARAVAIVSLATACVMDLAQVQIAAKYLTGKSATWGEGDWSGAPGGYAGNPPEGDGVFNQFDIVAAQQAAQYLSGPYAVVSASDAAFTAVPEPSAIVLAALGFAGILSVVWRRWRAVRPNH